MALRERQHRWTWSQRGNFEGDAGQEEYLRRLYDKGHRYWHQILWQGRRVEKMCRAEGAKAHISPLLHAGCAPRGTGAVYVVSCVPCRKVLVGTRTSGPLTVSDYHSQKPTFQTVVGKPHERYNRQDRFCILIFDATISLSLRSVPKQTSLWYLPGSHKQHQPQTAK